MIWRDATGGRRRGERNGGCKRDRGGADQSHGTIHWKAPSLPLLVEGPGITLRSGNADRRRLFRDLSWDSPHQARSNALAGLGCPIHIVENKRALAIVGR